MTDNSLKYWFNIILPAVLYTLANMLLNSMISYLWIREGIKCIFAVLLLSYMFVRKKTKSNPVDYQTFLFFVFASMSLAITAAFASGEVKTDISILEFIPVIFSGPICEEIIFRFFTFRNCNKILKTIPSVIITSILFAAGHTGFSVIIFAFAAGIIFSYVYLKTNSLIYPIIFHSTVNFLLCINFIYRLPVAIYVIFAICLIYSIINILRVLSD